jgi:hypothetical protein
LIVICEPLTCLTSGKLFTVNCEPLTVNFQINKG